MIDEDKLIEELKFQINNCETYGHSDIYIDLEMAKKWVETIEKKKVGKWISVEEREPSCSCTCLTWVKAKTTYSQYEKCVLANYYDGFFDVFPFDVFPYIDDEPNEVQILAWQPLPEPYREPLEKTRKEKQNEKR